MQDDILKLAFEVSRITGEKIAVIDRIMMRTRMLSMNARLESTRAGDAGLGFGVVAREMGVVAEEVNALSAQLQSEIAARLTPCASYTAFVVGGSRYGRCHAVSCRRLPWRRLPASLRT